MDVFSVALTQSESVANKMRPFSGCGRDDMAQAAMCRFLVASGSYKSNDVPYIRRVMCNSILSEIRRCQRHQFQELPIQTVALPEASVDTALESLKPELEPAARLFYQGYNASQICKILNISQWDIWKIKKEIKESLLCD
jgi:DNA-directed RNA polymerase specialized sigma24 family protein